MTEAEIDRKLTDLHWDMPSLLQLEALGLVPILAARSQWDPERLAFTCMELFLATVVIGPKEAVAWMRAGRFRF